MFSPFLQALQLINLDRRGLKTSSGGQSKQFKAFFSGSNSAIYEKSPSSPSLYPHPVHSSQLTAFQHLKSEIGSDRRRRRRRSERKRRFFSKRSPYEDENEHYVYSENIVFNEPLEGEDMSDYYFEESAVTISDQELRHLGFPVGTEAPPVTTASSSSNGLGFSGLESPFIHFTSRE